MKKHVFVDTNSCNADGSCRIHALEAKRFRLEPGELVTACMEGEEWDARVVRRDGHWGIELLSETREMSAERYEGQQEGCQHGMTIEKLRTLRVLENLGLPEELLAEAKRRLELV